MIIDLILDRKDGYKYNVEDFYRDCVEYGEVGFEITRALDSGTEEDVKQALCDYIIENDYNKNICKYINSVNWLDDSIVESKKSLKESIKKDIMKEVAKLIRNILKEGGYDGARVQLYQDLSVECLVWGNRKIRDYVISELEKYPNFKFKGEYEDDYVWEDGEHTIYLTIL